MGRPAAKNRCGQLPVPSLCYNGANESRLNWRCAAMLELRTRQVGPWAMNTYALVCPETGHSVLIDPGADPKALQEMLGHQKLSTTQRYTHISIDTLMAAYDKAHPRK